MPPPGGDTIGRRRLDPHLDAFRDMGAEISGERWIEITAPPTASSRRRIFMDEPSVMGTENALMAAALTPGPTTIGNAACEPHVQDLARLLTKMGAEVDGIGSNVMTVHGRDKLGGAEHKICPDHIEVASFMALAAATGGELRIRDSVPQDLITMRRHFRRLGLQTMVEEQRPARPSGADAEVQDDVGDAIPKIDDGPWPAFPADLTSIALALATQAEGTILIFEKMFENRLFFVDKLVAMGARITLCDPHRAIVSGPSRLHGERLESPDIRAGMAMLIAALAADGTSEIGNINQIDRGYERIDLRLRDLGAQIERVAPNSARTRPARRVDRACSFGVRRRSPKVAPDDLTRSHPEPGTSSRTRCASFARSRRACTEVFERYGYGAGRDADASSTTRCSRRGDERGAAGAPTASSTSAASCWRCAPT